MWVVDVTLVEKQIRRLPRPIWLKLKRWIATILLQGLYETRKIPGFHDEPLQGQLAGLRSVRLNRSWRVIYETKKDGEINIIQVTRVSKHEY